MTRVRTLEFTTPVTRWVTEQVPGSVKLTREIKQALRDWLAGIGSWDQRFGSTAPGRWVVEVKNGRLEGGSKYKRAPWDAAVRAAFATPDELASAARAARERGLL